MIYDLKYSLGLLITFKKRFVTILSMNFRAYSFVSQLTVVFGTVLSVSVVIIVHLTCYNYQIFR